MPRRHPCPLAFTLIELLVVIAIIAMLISILMPSLSRARDQGKGVHCLARLHDFANAFSAYENVSDDQLPPALWNPGVCCPHRPLATRHGWQEKLFEFVYRESPYIVDPECRNNIPNPDFVTQRNLDSERWASYFICKASSFRGTNAGHYRVYLPFWSYGTFGLRSDGTFDLESSADPRFSATRSRISPKMILIGDSNEQSYRGDGDPNDLHDGDDCSYIDAGEANEAGPGGHDGNRFSDRHYGGTNYLFQDFHGEWRTDLRKKLARDFDQNDIIDIEEGD